MFKQKGQKGFHVLPALLLILVLAAIGFVGWQVITSNHDREDLTTRTASTYDNSQPKTANVTWRFDGNEWRPSATPPACPEPLRMHTPADLSKVTGIIYPGQYRGGDFKTHGGFRFDNSKNHEIIVKIPMDAKLISASRYLDGIYPGDPQYFLIFVVPCGIMYRLDHITVFTDKFKKLTDILPPAKVNDSRTSDLDPPIEAKAGEVIGTAVGFSNNVFFDFGVNDLRQPNEISKNAEWAAKHQKAKHYDFYGVCWFDLLSQADAKTVRSILVAGKEGKTSDYCT